MLDKNYQPAVMETRRYALWEESGTFVAAPDSNKPPYTIMMPPPNVTGSLHMVHALTFKLQDVVVRYQRMRGGDVLWQSGTDHAGIATEIVVGNQLFAEGARKRSRPRATPSRAYGSGKRSPAVPSPANCGVLAPRPIGGVSGLRWIPAWRPRFAVSSFGFIGKA
jgi:hypothetical protein